MTTVNKSDKDRVVIFDTTLRDGEQCPGATMTFEEKLEIAEMLDDMGVDVIEAGFPIASRGDLEAVRMVAREVRTVPIAALARAKKDDVSAAIEALEPAAASRLHIFLATSDLHLQVKLNMTREQCLEAIGNFEGDWAGERHDQSRHLRYVQDRNDVYGNECQKPNC